MTFSTFITVLFISVSVIVLSILCLIDMTLEERSRRRKRDVMKEFEQTSDNTYRLKLSDDELTVKIWNDLTIWKAKWREGREVRDECCLSHIYEFEEGIFVMDGIAAILQKRLDNDSFMKLNESLRNRVIEVGDSLEVMQDSPYSWIVSRKSGLK